MTVGSAPRVVTAALAAMVAIAQPVMSQQLPPSDCLFPEEDPPIYVEPIELCGETILHADSSRVLRVELKEEITLTRPFGEGELIEIEGDGPFVGFILTEDVPGRDGRLLIAGYREREPAPAEYLAALGGPNHPGFEGTFPPGEYLLYLLASGSPMTLTLRLPGLPGRVEFEAETAVRFDARSLEPRIWEEAGRVIYSSGENGEMRTQGLLFASTWAISSNHLVSDVGTCIYDGPAPLAPIAFLPECPDGEGHGGTVFTGVPPRPSNFGHTTLIRGYAPGEYGLGGWYTSVSQPTDAGSVVFWLDLE